MHQKLIALGKYPLKKVTNIYKCQIIIIIIIIIIKVCHLLKEIIIAHIHTRHVVPLESHLFVRIRDPHTV